MIKNKGTRYEVQQKFSNDLWATTDTIFDHTSKRAILKAKSRKSKTHYRVMDCHVGKVIFSTEDESAD